jgi:hypothetical protein
MTRSSSPHRNVEPLAHPVSQRRVLERQVDAAHDDAASLVDRRRRAEPDGVHRIVDQLGDGSLELAEHVRLRVLRSRPLVPAHDVALAIDDPGEDLRAPEVYSDRMARLHSGYRNPPHGRSWREAVSRLSRRPDEGEGATCAA